MEPLREDDWTLLKEKETSGLQQKEERTIQRGIVNITKASHNSNLYVFVDTHLFYKGMCIHCYLRTLGNSWFISPVSITYAFWEDGH